MTLGCFSRNSLPKTLVENSGHWNFAGCWGCQDDHSHRGPRPCSTSLWLKNDLSLPVVWRQLPLFAQTGKSYLAGWFTAALCNRLHTSSVMIFVAGDRELASGNLNHLPVGAQQLTGVGGEVVLTLAPPAARSCFKCIEEGWHWATVHSHEDPAITCVCLGALSNTVGSAAEGGRRANKANQRSELALSLSTSRLLRSE